MKLKDKNHIDFLNNSRFNVKLHSFECTTPVTSPEECYLRLLTKIFTPSYLLFLWDNEKENEKIKEGIHFDQETNAHVRDSIPTG